MGRRRRSIVLGAASPRISLTRTLSGIQDCCPSISGSTRSRVTTYPVSPVSIWQKEVKAMEMLYRSVCGLDVHKNTVVACVRRVGQGDRLWKEVRTFATMTHNLRALVAWLRHEGVTHVAMESTGVLWKPVYNLLEEHFRYWWSTRGISSRSLDGRPT